jgi:hypothetical protein
MPVRCAQRRVSDPSLVSDPSVEHCTREKYCHNGGMAFAHEHGSDWLGVHEGDHGPFLRSLVTACLQGQGKGPRFAPAPFGGSDPLVCLAPVMA